MQGRGILGYQSNEYKKVMNDFVTTMYWGNFIIEQPRYSMKKGSIAKEGNESFLVSTSASKGLEAEPDQPQGKQ